MGTIYPSQRKKFEKYYLSSLILPIILENGQIAATRQKRYINGVFAAGLFVRARRLGEMSRVHVGAGKNTRNAVADE